MGIFVSNIERRKLELIQELYPVEVSNERFHQRFSEYKNDWVRGKFVNINQALRDAKKEGKIQEWYQVIFLSNGRFTMAKMEPVH